MTMTPTSAPAVGAGERALPEGWRWARLGDVCEIQLGKMLSPASKTGTRSRPYLRNANVQWGHFDLADIAGMDFTEAEEAKFALEPGDLLVGEGGEPGRAAVWQGEITPCCYQKALHRLRPVEKRADPHFIMYRLWHGALQGEFVGSHGQTTIAHLPAVRLAELPIALPSLGDQRRIAVLLAEQMAAVERARRAAVEQLAQVEQLPAAFLRQAFSGEQ